MNTQKIFSFFMAMLMVLSSFGGFALPIQEVQAATTIGLGNVVLSVKESAKDVIHYKGYAFKNQTMAKIGFTVNGKEYPAYCIEPVKNGVSENGTYSVTANTIYDNVKVTTAIANGFPFKTASEMGVDSDYDAYVVTKLAVWSVLGVGGYGTLSNYSAAPNKDNALAALLKLSKLAKAATSSPAMSENLTMNIVSEEVSADKSTSTQVFQIKSNGVVFAGEYTATLPSNAPVGTTITKNADKITVVVPLAEVPDNTSGSFNVELSISGGKGGVIVYAGYPSKSSSQSYAIAVEGTSGGSGIVNYKKDVDVPEKGSGKLRVLKREAGTLKPLEGAKFSLIKLDGTDAGIVGEFETDKNGEIVFSDLTIGAYEIREVTAPKGYIANVTTVKNVTITAANQTQQDITFDNTPTPKLKLLKTGTNGEVIAGAIFKIALDGGTESYIGTTDKSGNILFGEGLDLQPGNYSVTEIAVPQPYILDKTVKTVKLIAGKTTDVSFTNAKKPIWRLWKYIKGTSTTIDGAEFSIKNLDTNTLVWEGVVEDGMHSLDNLDPGWYRISEIATAFGYVMEWKDEYGNITSNYKDIKLEADKEVDIKFDNVRRPELEIEKIDNFGKPVVGAIFKFKKADGATQFEKTTDAQGKIVIAYDDKDLILTEGVYEITETKAPDGYIMSKECTQTVTLENGTRKILTFVNTKKPSLSLLKIDAKTKLPLAGAKFKIIKTDDKTIKEAISDKDGKVILTDLDAGLYTIEEITAPNGYIVETQHKDVNLVAGENLELVFENTKKPSLTIIKIDEATKLPLAGAKFKIIQTENKTIKEAITDKDGKIVLTDLDDVIYSIEEIVAPNGYILDIQHKDVKLKPGESMELVFTNKEKPKLRIQKVDGKTGEFLKNAEFTVTKVQDKTVSNYILENGEIILNNLDEGIYEAHEFMAPDGYVIVKDTLQIATEWGKTKTLKFDNIRKPVIIFKKTNALTNKGIPGTKFKVEYEMANGGVKSLGSFTTDADGKIIIPKGEPGWYIFTETLPAPGFSLSKSPVTRVYFAVGDNAYLTEFNKYYTAGTGKYASGYAPNDGVTNEGDKTIETPSNEPTNTDNGSANIIAPTSLSVHYGGEYYTEGEGFNWPLNSIVLKKADANTGKLLSGAAFELYRADEQVSGQPGTQIGRYVTDASGVVVIVGLEPGYYVAKEVQAPPNYILAETSLQNGFLKADGTTVLEFTFRNYPYGNILVTKIDGVTGEPLANATFKVTDNEGAVVGNTTGEFITDSKGEFLVSNIPPGSYVITEIKAPANYAINTTPKTIQVGTDGKTYKVSFDNYPYGAILISKVDGITGEPLANAKFKVIDNYGKVVGNTTGEFITDRKGEILIPNVAPGSYIATEIQAPENYAINTTPKTIQVGTDGKTYKMSFDNYPYGTVVLKKLDTDTKEPLSGAVFKVTTSKGDVVGTSNGEFTTDVKGTIVIPNITKGSYIVEEIKSPTGYILENQSKTITVDYGKSYTFEFFNKKMSSMQIVKIDGKTKQPLKDAEFKVYKMNGELLGTYKTDGEGLILFDKLQAGWYKVVETKAPTGYLIDDTARDVEITGNQFVKVVFENMPMSSLIIKKFDSLTKQPLLGAKFKITHKTGDVVGEYSSDANGLIQIDNLEPGWYTAKEITPPVGYKLYDGTQDFQVTNTKTVTLEFPNQKLTSLIIKKVDDKSAEPLIGAEFLVEKQNGEHVGEFTTDSDGTINIPTLTPDYYIVREKQAPSGYLLDESPKTVQVKTDVPTVITFTNKKLTSLQIKKIDEISGKALPGAVFEIERQNGEKITTHENGTEFTTDAQGFINVPTLTPDHYIVREVKAPEGYILDKTPKTVEVKTDSPTVVVFTNKYKSGLQIIKLDAKTNEPLAGARFTVYKKSGDVIGEFVTDANGVIILDQLENGWYKLAETKAPEGYVISEEPKDIEITGKNFHKIVFKNEKMSSLIIKKVDSIDKKGLEGAIFEVVKVNGEKIGEFTTDKTGLINIPNLKPDFYLIKELKSPTGYILNAEPKTIEMKTDKPLEVVFENTPLAGLQIKKINSETRQPIEGVEFMITKMNGEKVGNFKTDKQGMIFVNNLEVGTYIVIETKTAEGYLDSKEPKFVEITSKGKPVLLEIENKPVSSLLIFKTDMMTGKPLAGVVFDVKRADGQRIQGNIIDQNMPQTENNSPNKFTTLNGDISGSYTTDANGRILINYLTPGEYHIIETKQLPGYELDTEVHTVTITPGKQAVVKVQNKALSGLKILKIDSITKQPIFNVEFMVFDSNGKVVGTFYTDNNGIIDFASILTEGRYTVRETRAADGYFRDDLPRTVEFIAGKYTEIVWENIPEAGQIQITKLSANDNEINGLEAGTPLEGAIFEVFAYKSGNLVDRFITASNGKGVSKPLPKGRYTIKEVQAPPYYKISTKELDIEIEFATQIVKLEFMNESANTGVSIDKVGPKEVMPGNNTRYDIKTIRNNSSVPLTDFYWRDVLPVDAVRLDKIVTGTYNQSLKYKVMVTTNKGNSLVIADNMMTTKNNVISCTNADLGLANDEFVTSFTLYFGNVKAGFSSVEEPKVYVDVLNKNLPNGYKFANKVDIGGKYQGEWIVGNSTWVTTIYVKTPAKLPKTGN